MLVVDLVGAVVGDARRRHVGLLHAVDGGAGRVVFATDFGVAGVGGVVVEGGDFGDVLAVGLAVVLDSLGFIALVWIDRRCWNRWRCNWTYLVVTGSVRHDEV